MISAGIFVLTAGVVLALWWPATAGLSGQGLVTVRLDALRTGLSIGIGGGGIFALYLAWRRQHATEVGLVQKDRDQADVARAYELQREVAEHTRLHAERVAAATEKDAADRRITELYIKASEQLGSDKAPVRLAGLYALERLGQDNPDQRFTIANLWCAYLRMPYSSPPPRDTQRPRGVARPLLSNSPRRAGVQRLVSAAATSRDPAAAHAEAALDRDVRLTVQRLLATHLRPPASNDNGLRSDYWPEISALDLTEANLIQFDLSGCVLPPMHMKGATFTGPASFEGATFSNAIFDWTTFNDDAWFDHTTFDACAAFTGATFNKSAWFGGVDFKADAKFDSVSISGPAAFVAATFAGIAEFDNSAFNADAHGRSDSNTAFVGATFKADAKFNGAIFYSKVFFSAAAFNADAAFDDVDFYDKVVFGGLTTGATAYVPAAFDSAAGCCRARVRLAEGVPSQNTWPTGWTCAETTDERARWGRLVPVPVVLSEIVGTRHPL